MGAALRAWPTRVVGPSSPSSAIASWRPATHRRALRRHAAGHLPQHLAVLREAGLVSERRATGTRRFYRARPTGATEASRLAWGSSGTTAWRDCGGRQNGRKPMDGTTTVAAVADRHDRAGVSGSRPALEHTVFAVLGGGRQDGPLDGPQHQDRPAAGRRELRIDYNGSDVASGRFCQRSTQSSRIVTHRVTDRHDLGAGRPRGDATPPGASTVAVDFVADGEPWHDRAAAALRPG